MGERRTVTNKMAAAYRHGTRAEKSITLGQLSEFTGWHRELRPGPAAGGRGDPDGPGAQAAHPIYSAQVVSALELCWRVGRQPAGKPLAPMLFVLVPLLRRDGELDLTEEQALLLCTMSAVTIDRRLTGAKFLAELRGRSHTKPGTLSSPRSLSGPGRSGTRASPASVRSIWSATRAGTPLGSSASPSP